MVGVGGRECPRAHLWFGVNVFMGSVETDVPLTLRTQGFRAQSPSPGLPACGQCLELPQSGVGLMPFGQNGAVTGPSACL